MEPTATFPKAHRHRGPSRLRCKRPRSRCRSKKNHERSLHRNQQYSVIALTGGSGSVIERYAYSAYGTPTIADANGTARTITAIENRYTYTGREYDETLDLFHYRARMYDSVAGRFCSRDPIGYRGSKWSLFEYVSSKPVQRLDPLGLRDSSGGGGWQPSDLPWVEDFIDWLDPKEPRPTPPKPEPWELREDDWPRMVCNYYSDNPRPVVIKPGSPLHDKIFNSPSFAKCRAKAAKKAGEVSSEMGSGLGCWESESKSDSTDCVVNHIREMFTLGKSYVKVSIDCTSIGSCLSCSEDVIPSTSCKIKYTIRDSFKDPLDIGIEPGGTPFPMDGDFEEDWGGCTSYSLPSW